MTYDDVFNLVKSMAAEKPLGRFFALGEDGRLYVYGYVGMGDWDVILAKHDIESSVLQLILRGLLKLGDVHFFGGIRIRLVSVTQSA